MPIRPENKNRYPKDWKLRSKFVRFYRAKNKCEWCGVRNYSVGYRDENGKFHGACGSVKNDLAGEGLTYPSLNPINYNYARSLARELNLSEVLGDFKWIVIVLTVAHVHDHSPENCSLLNLAALCQWCHLNHDKHIHNANRVANKQKDSGQLVLI